MDAVQITEGLRALGKRSFVLSIHDQSFPCAPGQDTGRGSPYTEGGLSFLRFARELGFTGIQLGPQGQTSRDNQSPYDGTIFSKNILSIDLFALTRPEWAGILDPAMVAAVVAGRPPGAGQVQHRYLFDAQEKALALAYRGFCERRHDGAAGPLPDDFATFLRREHEWLEHDAQHEEAAAVERYCFYQFILHEQHRGLRQVAGSLGLKLYGDLQIGYSVQDLSSYRSLFLQDYVMGAPPSRTNPEGQPWNYPVLDPAQYLAPDDGPGPVLRMLATRVRKMLAEFDGLRIDHPHGLVCPWVYRAGQQDPLLAVQKGARLFSSPDLPDHPGLGRYSIVSPAQCSRDLPRHADGWVRDLSDEQVARYAILLDVIVGALGDAGRNIEDLVCEVLSTLPYPLARVLLRYGLGRFRVTQKANLKDPGDVYRSENAQPADWIMLGNHDTKPIWLLVEQWQRGGEMREQAEYLSFRLVPDPAGRASFATQLCQDPGLLVQAKFADLLLSPAEHVMVFFTDLLGYRDVYNHPGTISEDNWSLRLGEDYEARYRERLARNEALNVPLALDLALRARSRTAILRP